MKGFIPLKPLILRPHWYADIERGIQEIFDSLIYAPLSAALVMPLKEIQNTTDALYTAIIEGKIYYEDGFFKGAFNARISRELLKISAVFDGRAKVWKLPKESLPLELRIAQNTADMRFQSMRHNMLKTLDTLDVESVNRHLGKIKSDYSKAIEWMEGDFQKTVKGITIPPALTDAQRVSIARDWSDNLELYIKNWIDEDILKLRQEVQQYAFAGGRAENLAKIVRDNYGVSKNKAKFLARQETALLMAKYQETRYTQIGCQHYKWTGADDARERPDHRKLNGTIQRFDSPPITDHRTGARNNPGEDYNCRCIAVPLLPSQVNKS